MASYLANDRMKIILKIIRFFLFHILRITAPLVIIILRLITLVAIANLAIAIFIFYVVDSVELTWGDVGLFHTMMTGAGILAWVISYYYPDLIYFLDPED